MNIQTDPTQMEKTSASFPAITEEPIRSNFLPEERLRTLGASLAKGDVKDLFGLDAVRFPATRPRQRQQDPRSLPFDQCRAGERRDDHAGGAMAARQQLSGRGNHLPGQARPATPFLSAVADPETVRRRQRAARACAGLDLCRPFGQFGLGDHVQGDRRRLPGCRAAEDRRALGAAIAAALRTDRKSSPDRGPGQSYPADAPDRQRGRRPRAGDSTTAPTVRRSCRTTSPMHKTPPLPPSCSTACATGRKMPAGRWNGWRASLKSPAPMPRKSSSASIARCPAAT